VLLLLRRLDLVRRALLPQLIHRDELRAFDVLQLRLVGHDVHRGDAVDLAFVFHAGAHLRQPLGQFLVIRILILQAAHQLAALAGQLVDVQSQQLVLRHVDGDDVKVGLEAAAAAFHAAHADAADHLGLVAFADLAQFNAAVQLAAQALQQLAEIHALIGQIDEQHLGAVQRILGAQKMHVEVHVLDFLRAGVKGLLGILKVILVVPLVLFIRLAQNRLQRNVAGIVVRALRFAGAVAHLKALRGLHDDLVAFADRGIIRPERIGLAGAAEADGDDIGIRILADGIHRLPGISSAVFSFTHSVFPPVCIRSDP